MCTASLSKTQEIIRGQGLGKLGTFQAEEKAEI